MSPLFEKERLKTKVRYEYMCVDDEIIDLNLLNLPDDPETWLYQTEESLLYDMKSSAFYGQTSSIINDANSFDSSDKSIDSRTYTRRKRCSLRPSLESVSEVNNALLYNTACNASTRSSLGVLDLKALSTTLEADTLHGILKCTPTLETQREEDSLSGFVNSFDNQKYKKFQLNSTYLNETLTKPPPSSLPAENKHNGLNNNSTFNSRHSLVSHGISSTSPPINCSLNLTDSIVTKSTVHGGQDSLKEDIIDKLSKSDDEILNLKNETMIIASSTPLNEDKCVPPFNKFATITKKPRDLNSTFSKSSISSLRLQMPPNSVNSTLMNSKLNTTFTKSLTTNKTFCKSMEGVNGERESGTEDDQMSSASDSSFSSGTNLPRSVGDLQTIARQQEESLRQTHQSTPKRTNRVVEAKDAFFNCDDMPSPILNSAENGGSTSDLSERSSDTRSSSPSQSSHNNNRLPHPIASVLQQGDQGVLLQEKDRTLVKLPAKPGPSGLRMPSAVSRLPTTMSRLPTARGRGIRPATASTTGIPRPASRLPAPRFRSSTVLQAKPH